eukprot:87988-Prymnesium_polylepis.2
MGAPGHFVAVLYGEPKHDFPGVARHEPKCWSQYGSSADMARLGVTWPYARCGHTATVLNATTASAAPVGSMLLLGGARARRRSTHTATATARGLTRTQPGPHTPPAHGHHSTTPTHPSTHRPTRRPVRVAVAR